VLDMLALGTEVAVTRPPQLRTGSREAAARIAPGPPAQGAGGSRRQRRIGHAAPGRASPS